MNNLSRDAERQGNNNTTERQSNTTQHNSPETVIFQRKIGCLGWDSNPRPSAVCTCIYLYVQFKQLLDFVHILVQGKLASHKRYSTHHPSSQGWASGVLLQCVYVVCVVCLVCIVVGVRFLLHG